MLHLPWHCSFNNHHQMHAQYVCLIVQRLHISWWPRSILAFCKPCVDVRLATRQRKCPYCNLAFGQSDVHTFFFQGWSMITHALWKFVFYSRLGRFITSLHAYHPLYTYTLSHKCEFSLNTTCIGWDKHAQNCEFQRKYLGSHINAWPMRTDDVRLRVNDWR